MSEPRVAIIGGGVSGLATAYFLAQQGIRSVLIEKSTRLGGLVQTDSREGCLLEAGPDSYLAAKPAVTELARELPGLTDQIIGSNDTARRIFVVRDSQLLPMPRGMLMMVPGDLSSALRSPLFSATTKLRFLSEMFQRPRVRQGDFSVGEFVTDHFGSELLVCAADPLLAGVYGGSSRTLSAPSVLPRMVAYEREYGSLVRAVRRERQAPQAASVFLSFRGGMQSLTDALANAAATHIQVIHGAATRLVRRLARWRVDHEHESVDVDDVVLACPAYVSAQLIESVAPEIAAELRLIPYSSAILATLVYDRKHVSHPLAGFGFLVPEPERRTIAAATWISTKFPSRIRPDLVALRAFIVADTATRLADAAQEHILELVRADFARLMGIDASPCFSTVHAWPKSMPQYIVGHQDRIRSITAALDQLPGLYVCGNAYDGVGIPDCIRVAKETAKRLCERMNASSL